jgi:pyrophosphatase PpaX
MINNSPKRGFLFDFDGTLARSLGHWADAYNEALVSRGISVERETLLAACFGPRAKEFVEQHRITDRERFYEEVWSCVKERVPLMEPYPGVSELLAELKASGAGLAVVTNSRRGHVQPALERWGLTHLFDTLVSIEDVSHGKPDPEAIHKALRSLSVSPADAFMIGDSPADILAGSRAQVRTVAFSPSENKTFFSDELLQSHDPHHTTQSYEELRLVLLKPSPRQTQS